MLKGKVSNNYVDHAAPLSLILSSILRIPHIARPTETSLLIEIHTLNLILWVVSGSHDSCIQPSSAFPDRASNQHGCRMWRQSGTLFPIETLQVYGAWGNSYVAANR